MLNGNEKRYASIWSDMISTLSKKERLSTKWMPKNRLIYQDEPYHFEVQSILDSISILNTNETYIPLKGDVFSKQHWSGIDYPHKIGWNTLSIKNDSLSKHQYYVYDTSNWQAIRANHILKNTVATLNAKQIQSEIKKVFLPVSLFWFFITFLVSVSYLWAAPRFGV